MGEAVRAIPGRSRKPPETVGRDRMTARYDIAALKSRLEGIRTEDNPALVRQKSRDFYWYSPILKRQLDQVTADVVVSPTSEAEVIARSPRPSNSGSRSPPRGTGTGNYGQAMPLSGGIVLDLSGFDAVKQIAPGRIVAEPGAVIAAIDRQTRPHSAQEIRLHPSTYNTASIGGFVAGGSGGVGSIKWGGLRDAGNIIRLKIVTMEKTPRVLELAGEELHKVAHAYGTNGIITEVEMPLAPAYDWIDLVLGFDTLAAAAAYANALGEAGRAPDQAARGHRGARAARRFSPSPEHLPRDKHLALVMVAPHALDALLAFTRRFRNAEVLLRQDQMSETDLKGLPPVFELSWNHTTLRALRVDPTFTYLQTLYPFPEPARPRRAHPRALRRRGAGASRVRPLRRQGHLLRPAARPLHHRGAARGDHRHPRGDGRPVFNPHRYTLEEGGMKRTDAVQLAFKREADPQGLLNPGKMIAWEDPAYDYRTGKTFLFRGFGAGCGGADDADPRPLRSTSRNRPPPASYSAALHRTVVETLRSGGHEVDDCDLYAEKFDPVLTRTKSGVGPISTISRQPARKSPTSRRLRQAEALVLVFPVWNFGFPAILKGFLDRVFLPGVSFRLEDGLATPDLTHLRVIVAVTTYGAPRWRLSGRPAAQGA